MPDDYQRGCVLPLHNAPCAWRASLVQHMGNKLARLPIDSTPCAAKTEERGAIITNNGDGEPVCVRLCWAMCIAPTR
eukprot:7810553-Alexandrium_andersonii.AAC.1